MDTINTVKVKDSLQGYNFSSEEAQRNLSFIFNRITDSEDELRDLIYYLQHDRYSKALLQDEDIKPFVEKMNQLTQHIDSLYDYAAIIFKTKGLLVKQQQEAEEIVEEEPKEEAEVA